MVAETVKSYPVAYPALLKLSPSVGGLPAYTSCASSLLQNAYPSSFSPPPHREQRSSSQDHIEDSGSGLSASGMSIDLNPSSSRKSKSDVFSQRKQREFIPDNKKDDSYWDRRRRNNEAAKRSREKRRFNDMILEQRVLELSKENHILKAQLTVIKEKYGIQGEGLINLDQVLSSMPQAEQLLAINKRNKLGSSLLSLSSTPPVSLLSPNGLCSSGPGSPHPSQYSSQLSPPSPTPSSHYNYSRDGRESPEFYQNSNTMDEDDDQEDMQDMQDIQTHQNHLLQIPQYAPHQYQDIPGRKQVPFYEQKALNLSARSEDDHSSISPSSPPYSSMHEDFSTVHDVEMSRHSPLLQDSGSCLPHKLRHKTHLGEKDAAQSLLALHGIKSEPRDHYHEDDSASSDERDSAIGMSSSSSPHDFRTGSSSTTSLEAADESCRSSNEDLEYENANLRSQLQHLATEVANIKCILGRRPQTFSETDSDGSR